MPGVLDILELCMTDPEQSVREAAVEKLALIPGKRSELAIRKALHDRAALVRSVAAEVIGARGMRTAVPDLIQALEQKERRALTRICSAESLGLLGAKPAIPALLKVLKGDKDPLGRAYAAEALGRIGDRRVIQHLHSQLRNERRAEVRLRIFAALYALGEKRRLSDVIGYLNAQQSRARIAAAQTLVELADHSTRQAIADALERRLARENSAERVHAIVASSLKNRLLELRRVGNKRKANRMVARAVERRGKGRVKRISN